MVRIAAVVVVLLFPAVFVACEKLGEGHTCKSTGAITVELTDAHEFVPSSVTIQTGGRVCWQNFGTMGHSITSDTPEDNTDITMPPSFIYTKTFGKAQDFHYHCSAHEETGVVFVR